MITIYNISSATTNFNIWNILHTVFSYTCKYFQNISEERIVRIFQNKKRLNQKEGVNVISFTGEFKKSISSYLYLLSDFILKILRENVEIGRAVDK